MAADDEVDLFAPVVQRVCRREVTLARHAENGVDTLCGQRVDQQPGAGLGFVSGHQVPSLRGVLALHEAMAARRVWNCAFVWSDAVSISCSRILNVVTSTP